MTSFLDLLLVQLAFSIKEHQGGANSTSWSLAHNASQSLAGGQIPSMANFGWHGLFHLQPLSAATQIFYLIFSPADGGS